MKIVSPNQMKRMDLRTVEDGICSSLQLMQNAAKALYREVSALMEREGYDRVLLLAGSGNNGGDAYALACLLYPTFSPAVLKVGDGAMSEDCRHYYEKAVELGIPFVQDPCGYPLVVDGIFGTGFHGDLPEKVKALLEKVNAPVVAIDLPSGMDGNSGICAESSLKPILTVTFAYKKPCHLFADCGKVVVADIGIPATYSEGIMVEELECNSLPSREEWGHKSSFGDVGLLVGASPYCGAAALALKGAMMSGAGLIYGYLPSAPRRAAAAKFFGPILKPARKVRTDYHGVWLGGSGLGRGALAGRRMAYLWKYAPVLVADGDGLWHIRNRLSARKGYLTVLTPHMGEFARLLGVDIETLQKNRLKLAEDFAKEHELLLVLKDAATLVTDGVHTAILSAPCSALSRGGSGDLLAGLLAGLLASSRCENPFEAVKCGVWLHNRAAHLACEDHSPRTLQPEVIAEYIDQAIKELE